MIQQNNTPRSEDNNSVIQNLQDLKIVVGGSAKHLITRTILWFVTFGLLAGGLAIGTVGSINKCRVDNWVSENYDTRLWQECKALYELDQSNYQVRLDTLTQELKSVGVLYADGKLVFADGKFIDIKNLKADDRVLDLEIVGDKLFVSSNGTLGAKGVTLREIGLIVNNTVGNSAGNVFTLSTTGDNELAISGGDYIRNLVAGYVSNAILSNVTIQNNAENTDPNLVSSSSSISSTQNSSSTVVYSSSVSSNSGAIVVVTGGGFVTTSSAVTSSSSSATNFAVSTNVGSPNSFNVAYGDTFVVESGNNLVSTIDIPNKKITLAIVATPTFANLNVTGNTNLNILNTIGNNNLGGNTTVNNINATGTTTTNGITNNGTLIQNGNVAIAGNTAQVGNVTNTGNLTQNGNTTFNGPVAFSTAPILPLTSGSVLVGNGSNIATATPTGDLTSNPNLIVTNGTGKLIGGNTNIDLSPAFLTSFGSLTSGLVTANNNIAGLTTQVGTNVANITTNTADILSLQSSLVTTNTNLGNLTTQVGTNATNIANNTTDILVLQNGLATTNTNVTNLGNSLNTTNTNATNLQNGLATTNTNLSTLATQVGINTNDIAILNSALGVLSSSSHPATTVTLSNGLSINGTQGLSLTLASSNGNGALSSTDWNIFNNKQDTITPLDLTAASNKVTVTGGIGATLINTSVDVNEANLDLANIGGSLSNLQQNALNLSNIGGNLSTTQQNALNLSNIGGNLSTTQQNALDLANIGGTLTAAQQSTILLQNLGGNLSTTQQNAINFSNLTGSVDLTTQTTGLLPLANLTSGTNGQVLTTVAGVPTWTTQINALTSAGNILSSTVNGISQNTNIINNVGLTTTGTTLNTDINGVLTSVNLQPVITAGTTFLQSTAGNVLSSTVNGITQSSNLINSNSVVTTGNLLTSTVNGLVSGTTPIINSNTSTLSGSNLVTTVNGVASAPLDLLPLLTGSTTNTLTISGTNLTSTVNGVASTQDLQSAINAGTTVSNSLSGSSLTTTVNGVTGSALDLLPLLTGSTTNSLTLSGNTLTSNVNGLTSTSNAIGSNIVGSTGNNFTTTVNGVLSNTGTIINSGALTSTNNTLSGNVNGVSLGSVNLINSNSLISTGNTLESLVNGISAGTQPIINSNTTSTSGNLLTTTVNGVVSNTSPIINTNTLGLSGTNLTSTTNGVASNVLDLTPLLTAGTTNVLTSTGNSITSNVNGVSQTTNLINSGALISSVNTLSGNVNGVSLGSVNLVNSNSLTGTGTTLTSNINGISSAFDIQPLINAGTTNTLVNNGINTLTNATNGVIGTASIINTNLLANNGTNGFTSTVNGVSSGLQPIINSNALSLSGTNLTSTVNGVVTNQDLQSAINAGTTVSNSLVGTNLTTTVNGVTGAALDLASLQPTADNGLTINPANNVQLGGALVQDTTVDGQNTYNLDLLGNLRASLIGFQTQIGGQNSFNSTDPYQIAIGHDNVLSATDQYVTGNNNTINAVGSTNLYINGYNNRISSNPVTNLYNLGGNNDFQGGDSIIAIGSNNVFKDPSNITGTVGFSNLNYGTESFVFGSNLITSGDRTVSLGTNDSTKAVIDNSGRLTIRGAFAPNGIDGNPNQVLISNGTSLSPTWTDVVNLLPATTNTLVRSGNNLTSTVNGVQSITQAIGSNAVSLTGSNLTTTVNGVPSNSLNLLPLLTGSTTNTLANNGTNGLTSTVNGVSSGLQPIINSNTLATSGTGNNILTNLTNGIGNSINIIGSNTLSLAGNTLTSTVNGVASNTTFSVATLSNTGLLTAADWNTFNNKVTSVTNGGANSGITIGGTAQNPTISATGLNATPCTATQKLFWNGAAFSCTTDIDTDTGITSLTAVGSTPNANGGTIAGTALTLQPADLTNPGVVTALTQTLGGVKTFNSTNTDFFNGANATNDIFRITPNAGTGTQFIGNLTTANLSGAKTWTLPDVSGTVCLRENCLTSIAASTGTTGLTLTPTTSGTGAVTQVLAGTLATANGGTGLTTVGTAGQVLTSNGTTLSYTTPTVTAGNVTGANNLTSATTGVTVTGGTGATLTATSIAIQNATATQPGLLTAADFTTFNSKLSSISGTGNGLFTVTGGNTVTGTTCATTNQILKWNGTAFACAADSGLTAAIASINGDTTTAQTIVSGNAGTALAVSTAGGVTTINIPLAGIANTQGLISNGSQVIGGNKTFDSVVSIFKNSASPTADIISIEPNLTAGTSFNGKITSADLTGNQTYTLPNASGTVCLSSNNCGFVSGTANNLTTTTTGLSIGSGTGATLTAATVNYNLAAGIAGLTAGVQGALGGTGTANTYVGADGQLHLLPSAPVTTTVNGSAGAITLAGTNSITGNGTTTPFQLVNDSPTPGNSLYYGTNATGTKGFFTLPTTAATTNTLVNNGVNGLTSTVNGISSGTQPIINTVTTALSGNLILTTVNGVTSAGANIPNATLAGFTPSTNTAITATDSIIQALQKLQAGNTAQDSSIGGLNAQITTINGNLSLANANIANNTTAITALQGLSHSPVTLGTANGLSLAGQVLSLATANTTTTGALTAADWNTFNSKLSTEVDGIIGNELANVGATTALVRAGAGTTGSPYTVDVKPCANNEILKYAIGTSTWVCGADTGSVVTPATLTSPTTGVTVTGGTGATLTAASIAIQNATAGQPGLLTAADFTTFNNKENPLTFIGNGLFSRAGNTITGNGLVAGAGISISGTTISNSGVTTINGFSGPINLQSANSVIGSGTAANPFTLSGDVTAPGNSFYYGTNGAGTKGYFALPSGSGVTTIGTAGGSIANGASISGNTLTLGFSNATNPGILSSADWTTFNNKENPLTFSGPLSRTGNAISIAQANTTTAGFLTAADWNTFNSKLSTEVDGIIGNEVTNTTNTSLLRSGAGTAGSPYTLGVNLTPTGTASTATTNSGSGLEISGGLGLIRGCTNAQVLKWNNTTKAWECANDTSVMGVDVIAAKNTTLTAAMSNTAQVVVFNTETQDTNAGYNNTTGIYTAPVADTYKIESSLGFTRAGLNMRNPCMAIRRAGVIIVSTCNADYNDTGGGSVGGRDTVDISATITLTAGQTVDVITYVDTNPATGTVPTFEAAGTSNYLTIQRVGNASVIASDRDLKKEIKSFDLGLKDLMDVNTVSYLYNGKAIGAQNDGIEHVGIIAQDLQNTRLGQYAVKQGTDGYLRYDPTSLLYATINGVKELNTGFKQNSFGMANISGLSNIFGNSALTLAPNIPVATTPVEPKGIGEQLVESLTNSLQSVKDLITGLTNKLNTNDSQIQTLNNQNSELKNKLNNLETRVNNIPGNTNTVSSSSVSSSVISSQTSSNSISSTTPVVSSSSTTQSSISNNSSSSVVVESSSFQSSSSSSVSTNGDTVIASTAQLTEENIFQKLATFIKNIVVNGTAWIQDLVVKGSTVFQGRVTYEDIDAGGFAVIPAGQSEVEVVYAKPYASKPVVNITVEEALVTAIIKDSKVTGFKIKINPAQSQDVIINWTAKAVKGATPPVVSQIVSSSSTSSVTGSVANSSTVTVVSSTISSSIQSSSALSSISQSSIISSSSAVNSSSSSSN
jgi:trimeric autotransporter adhesin